ncbi:MAG: helicase HerA domain-containing protein [Aquificaceae bacterium]
MKEFFDTLKDRVAKARESLKIASPWIDLCLLEKLLEVLPKGVRIEVILRAEELKDLAITGEGTFRTLEKHQAEIYLSHRLHAKLVIVDGLFALVGSANLTGAGMRGDGNLEAVVFLEGEEVKRLLEIFEDFKRQSVKLLRDVSAVVISVESSTEATLLLLEDMPEQSFLWVEKEGYKLLCKLTKVYTQGSALDLPEGFLKSKGWTLAHLRTLLRRANYLGKVKVLLELREEKEGYFGTPLKGLNLGDQLLPVKREDKDLQRIMKTNLSGYSMDIPLRVGKLVGKEVDVYVDMAKLTSMHMALLGTTGSGKTTFVIRLLENMPRNTAKVFIFDLFGEYSQKLKEKVYHAKIPYTLLPLWVEDIKELFRDYGLVLQERSEEEKGFLAQMRSHLKPNMSLSSYRERSLRELFLENSKGGLKRDVQDLILMLSKELGEEVLENQPRVFKLLEEALSSEEDIVLLDVRDVVNLSTRLNLVGLVLREIFSMARLRQERRLIVLEEAHNFAPERGATEVPTGRENLAINMTKKIALEGRKFSLGLLAISQRPANLSKYVLSQLNTQAIFRLITQNDIEAVSQFFEYPQEDQLRLIPTLKPGYLFLSGIGVPFSMLVEIEL